MTRIAGSRIRARPAAALVAAVLACASCRTGPAAPWDASSGEPRPARVALPVEGEAQARSLSCESRSACDLLGWLGRPMEEDAFLAGLARSDNPDEGFVGDVDGPGGRLPPEGYGVHAEPVAARLRALGVAAEAVRNANLEWLRDRIAEHRPVIVWATATLDAARPLVLRDGRNRRFRAVRGEHTFLAVGYRPGDVLLLDPARGETRWIPWRRFDASWSSLERMAVVAETASGRCPND